jgi:hypothetical protein
MTRRARDRWRFGLTIVAAIVLVVSAASCMAGVFVHWGSASSVSYDASIARGALHLVYSDRSGTVGKAGLPDSGWKGSIAHLGGSPVVEWLPDMNNGQGALSPSWFIRVPLWPVLLLLGLGSAWTWWRWLSDPATRCASCGYDLAGLKGDVCPECGTAMSEPGEKSA